MVLDLPVAVVAEVCGRLPVRSPERVHSAVKKTGSDKEDNTSRNLGIPVTWWPCEKAEGDDNSDALERLSLAADLRATSPIRALVCLASTCRTMRDRLRTDDAVWQVVAHAEFRRFGGLDLGFERLDAHPYQPLNDADRDALITRLYGEHFVPPAINPLVNNNKDNFFQSTRVPVREYPLSCAFDLGDTPSEIELALRGSTSAWPAVVAAQWKLLHKLQYVGGLRVEETDDVPENKERAAKSFLATVVGGVRSLAGASKSKSTATKASPPPAHVPIDLAVFFIANEHTLSTADTQSADAMRSTYFEAWCRALATEEDRRAVQWDNVPAERKFPTFASWTDEVLSASGATTLKIGTTKKRETRGHEPQDGVDHVRFLSSRTCRNWYPRLREMHVVLDYFSTVPVMLFDADTLRRRTEAGEVGTAAYAEFHGTLGEAKTCEVLGAVIFIKTSNKSNRDWLLDYLQLSDLTEDTDHMCPYYAGPTTILVVWSDKSGNFKDRVLTHVVFPWIKKWPSYRPHFSVSKKKITLCTLLDEHTPRESHDRPMEKFRSAF